MKLLATISSILSITSPSSINAIRFRILLFLVRSVHMCTIGASYLGLTYIIVYTGGISILFLFVIRRLFPSLENQRGSALSALPLGAALVALVWGAHSLSDGSSEAVFPQPFAPNRIDNIARYLYAPDAVWLLVLGVRFLVARVGCIVLCLRDLLTPCLARLVERLFPK